MKIIKIISEHKQKKSKGQVEAIVRLEDGSIVTRHLLVGNAKLKQEEVTADGN